MHAVVYIMFGKKCTNCGKRIGKDFDFCPYCGYVVKKERGGLLDNIEELYAPEEMGMSDIEQLTRDIGKSLGFDFIDRFPFNHIVKKLGKDIEKQFKDIDKEIAMKKIKGKEEVTRKNGTEIRKTSFPGGFSIQIRIGGAVPEHILPEPTFPRKQLPAKQFLIYPEKLSKKHGKLATLPRREPETKVRRLTDKIVYEISMPGVKSIKDVTVNKLENSIEIKAVTKDMAYFKLIPISLPLKKYYFEGEKLILELSPEE